MKVQVDVFKIILLRLGRWKATIPLVTLLLLGFGGAAQAQDTVFTYQGRVLANGTNFTGTGQFKFALITSTNIIGSQATATAILGGTSPYEYVVGYTIVSGGSGYLSPPTVTVSGPSGSGSTATALAIISGGVVTAINVINPGWGYSSTPVVTIGPPPEHIVYFTYWSNDGTGVNGSEPTAAVGVAVSNGLFTVALGDTTLANMTAIPVSLFTQPGLQLQIWFSDGVNGFALLNPLQNLTPAPYAIMANAASNLMGTLPAAQLIGTVGNSQLASNSVTVNAGTGLSGGGTVPLGGSTTLNNTGVLSVSGNADITASTVNGVVTLGDTAASANTPSSLIKRDANGNFAAGTITASLAGNATSANTANGFSGSLAGDVTGTQGATVVGSVGGQSAANVASGASAANAATSAATPGALVQRDASGSFVAANITVNGTLTGNGEGLTNLNAAHVSGTLANGQLANSSVMLNAGTGLSGGGTVPLGGSTTLNNSGVLSVSGNGDITASTVNGVVSLGDTAASANTPTTLVKRDANGNFAAGTITASLAGNAASANTANGFSGSLAGDVTGTQGATLVGGVGGQSAASVASVASAANAATSAATPGAIVQRDATGSFVAANITVSGAFTGNGAGLTSLNGSSIQAGTVGSSQLAAGAVTALNIASNTITPGQVALGFGFVPSGGIVLSATLSNAAFASAGLTPVLSPLGTSWTQVTSAAPWSTRYGRGAVALNGQMWVLGGYNGNYYLNDVWSSSDGVTWTQVTSAAPWSAREEFGAVALNGQMWVLGGSGSSNFHDVWSSSDGVTWNQATSAASWSTRYGFGALALNGQMWVLGGYNGSFFNDVWCSQSAAMLGGFYLFQKQ